MEKKKKEYKLIWTDGNRTKTAKGSGREFHKDSEGNIIIIFHGYQGDIYLTPMSFEGRWMIS